MFFFLSVLSMLSYSVQFVFLTKYARSMDALSLAIYRNLSLGITMLPLIFFVGKGETFRTLAAWPILAASASTGGIALFLGFLSQRFLPVGISTAIGSGRVVLIFLWAYLFLQETVSLKEFLFALMIMAGVAYLSLQKHHMSHLDKRTRHGLWYALGSTAFGSVAFFLVMTVARQTNPLAAGYFWELFIGFAVLILGFARYLVTGKKVERIPRKTLLIIVFISSSTLLGTGALTLAGTMGPMGIVGAIGVAGIVVTTILSHFLYNERLNIWQWMGIGVISLGTVGLKLVEI